MSKLLDKTGSRIEPKSKKKKLVSASAATVARKRGGVRHIRKSAVTSGRSS